MNYVLLGLLFLFILFLLYDLLKLQCRITWGAFKDVVLGYVKEHPGADQEDVSKQFGVSDTVAMRVLDELREEGLLGPCTKP